jgi:hypothetical protein
LEVRPLRRQLAELVRKARAGGMSQEEFDIAERERQRLTREISSRFPEELLKRKLRRGDVDAR